MPIAESGAERPDGRFGPSAYDQYEAARRCSDDLVHAHGALLVLEARARLAVVVPFALALILFLLWLTFGSMRAGLLIFLNVPFAVVGGVVALWLRGIPFSISAGVGFIAGPRTITNSPYCGASGGASSTLAFFTGTGTVFTEPMRFTSCFIPGPQGTPFCIDTLPLASVHL